MTPVDPVTEPPHGTPTAGEQLQAARAARGWSAQEVASRLRIRPALVEALERDDYAPFLAVAYARGQLRNYARLVGLDAEALLARFEAPSPGPAGRALHRAPELHPRRPWLVRIGGFVIVGALVVLGALWAKSGRAPQSPAEPAPSVAQVATSPRAEPPAPATAPPPVDVPPADGDTPATSAMSAPVATPPSEPVAPPAETNTPPSPEPATAAPAGAELRLRSRAVSWVEVTDHRGQRLIYELVGPDLERVVRGEPPLRVLLGNAPAVDVVFAGQPVALPPGQHVVRMTLGAAAPSPAGAVSPAMPTP